MKNFIRLNSVKSMTGLSRSTIYEMIKSNKFPKQIPLGIRAVGWLESEVNEWIEERVSASRIN